jgi:hypothetical protein
MAADFAQAGLFSATSTAFLQFTLPLLQKGTMDDTNQLLLDIFQKLNEPSHALSQQRPFIANATAISINCLVFASIAGSLIAAFFALSIKQWARSYVIGLENIITPQLMARHRQFRIEGVRQWHLVDIASLLPVLLHISLSLFAIGVAEFLLYTSGIKVALVIIVAAGITSLIHIFLSLTPIVYPQSPFQSPLMKLIESFLTVITTSYKKLFNGSHVQEEHIDSLDQALGKETALSRLIHTSKHLDIGVLITLMEVVDRHMEDWVLDLCLAEFAKLRHIPHDKYHLFCHDTIFNAYHHIAATCITESKGTYTIAPGMEYRAETACKSLIWFDSIASSQCIASFSPKFAQLGSSEDTDKLTGAYYDRAVRSGSLHDLVEGYLAIVASTHLQDVDGLRMCPYCFQDTEGRSRNVLKFLLDHQINKRDIIGYLEDRRSVISYICLQIRCTLKYKGLFFAMQSVIQSFKMLVRRYELDSPALSEEWKLQSPCSSPFNTLPPNLSWMSIFPAAYRYKQTISHEITMSAPIHPSANSPWDVDSYANIYSLPPPRKATMPNSPPYIINHSADATYRLRPRNRTVLFSYPAEFGTPRPQMGLPKDGMVQPARSIGSLPIRQGTATAITFQNDKMDPGHGEYKLPKAARKEGFITLDDGGFENHDIDDEREREERGRLAYEEEKESLHQTLGQSVAVPNNRRRKDIEGLVSNMQQPGVSHSHQEYYQYYSDGVIHAHLYCDIYVTSNIEQPTTIRIQPAASMVLTGSSLRGDQINQCIEFSVRAESRRAVESVSGGTLESSLFYTLRSVHLHNLLSAPT